MTNDPLSRLITKGHQCFQCVPSGNLTVRCGKWWPMKEPFLPRRLFSQFASCYVVTTKHRSFSEFLQSGARWRPSWFRCSFQWWASVYHGSYIDCWVVFLSQSTTWVRSTFCGWSSLSLHQHLWEFSQGLKASHWPNVGEVIAAFFAGVFSHNQCSKPNLGVQFGDNLVSPWYDQPWFKHGIIRFKLGKTMV